MIKKAYLWTVAFALAGCTASQPTEYHRGTLRPPPAQHRPGVGAPIIGPSQAREDVPRVPGRLLPETPETRKGPGLWASKRLDPDAPQLLDVLLPLPDDVTEREKHKVIACVMLGIEGLGRTINLPTVQQAASFLKSIPPKDQACLAARIYRACADNLMHAYLERKASGALVSPTSEAENRRIKGVADKFEKRSCSRQLSSNASTLSTKLLEWFSQNYTKGPNETVH